MEYRSTTKSYVFDDKKVCNDKEKAIAEKVHVGKCEGDTAPNANHSREYAMKLKIGQCQIVQQVKQTNPRVLTAAG